MHPLTLFPSQGSGRIATAVVVAAAAHRSAVDVVYGEAIDAATTAAAALAVAERQPTTAGRRALRSWSEFRF